MSVLGDGVVAVGGVDGGDGQEGNKERWDVTGIYRLINDQVRDELTHTTSSLTPFLPPSLAHSSHNNTLPKIVIVPNLHTEYFWLIRWTYGPKTRSFWSQICFSIERFRSIEHRNRRHGKRGRKGRRSKDD